MKKSDREYVAAKVDWEGFDYAFRHYSNFEDIEDPKFHELRLAYVKAAKDLAEYLGLDE
jgi:hypothetical protein